MDEGERKLKGKVYKVELNDECTPEHRYYLVEADSEDEAVEWAKKHCIAEVHKVNVRSVTITPCKLCDEGDVEGGICARCEKLIVSTFLKRERGEMSLVDFKRHPKVRAQLRIWKGRSA